jgi:hypothetical protein
MTATDKGVVESIMDQGIEKFKVTMNYFDVMSTTLAEHKSGRLADWETDLSSKYVDKDFVRLMNPDELARMAASDVGDRYAALGSRILIVLLWLFLVVFIISLVRLVVVLIG